MNQFNFPGLTLMKAIATAESIQDSDDQSMFLSSVTQDCTLYHRVAAFMYFFGQLEKDKPLGFDESKLALGLNLVIEEFKEIFEKGLGIQCDVTFRYKDFSADDFEELGWITDDIGEALKLSDPAERDIAEFADAIGDLKYVAEWNSLAHGIPQPLVDWEIHCSNMTKFGEGGKPILNGITEGYRVSDGSQVDHPDAGIWCDIRDPDEDGYDSSKPIGKVLKGPNYVAPDIKSILGLGDSN